jgi:hypothetical protein
MSMPTTDASARALLSASTPPASPPLLVPIPEARRHFGSIGTTAFYAAVKRYDIRLVALGGRSLVPMTEIERVVAQLIAERSIESSQKAKALASISVAARRRRRGSVAP